MCHAALPSQTTPAGGAKSDGIEDIYLAKDNGDGKPGDQVTQFGINDIPIHCVIMLGTTTIVTVKMNFVAVKVTGVKPDTRVVTASYTTKEGQNRVNFTGRPYGKWTPGQYRVDIFLDGKLTKNVEFAITTDAAGPKAPKTTSQPAGNPKTAVRSPNN